MSHLNTECSDLCSSAGVSRGEHHMSKKTALCEFLLGKTGLCEHGRLWILHHLIYIYLRTLNIYTVRVCLMLPPSVTVERVTVRVHPRVFFFLALGKLFFSSSSSSSCSLNVRYIPCSLILKVELVPPSLLRSSHVPSSFWSVFQCLSWQSISVHPLYVL